MKKLTFAALLLPLMLLALTASNAQAEIVPQTLSYQGTLATLDGTPFSGVKSMTFRLYDAATAGNLLWEEAQSNVHIVNGRFATVLGSVTPLSNDLFFDKPAAGDAVYDNALHEVPVGTFSDQDQVWLEIQVEGDSPMSPRQQLNSVPFAYKAENGIPYGGIIMWSGTVANIPDGWALCDGTNGTPNLKGRFVVNVGPPYSDGSGTNYQPGHMDGYERIQLTLAELPQHNHHDGSMAGYKFARYNGSWTIGSSEYLDNSPGEVNLFDDGTYPLEEGNDQSHENRPPFYALAYIMRIR
ncbi:MAG: hypothetical protein C0622_09860 [Desulfuromonas sp.]|nr:MAG: hypothetical protein C0622_09860 [Desulfuromonas sp.]